MHCGYTYLLLGGSRRNRRAVFELGCGYAATGLSNLVKYAMPGYHDDITHTS